MASATTDTEDELVMSMNRRLQAFDCPVEMPEQNEEPRTICRVPPSARNQHGEEFDPKIISIGPLHRQKKELCPMQQLKWKYLHDLIRRSREESMLPKYIRKVRELEPRARKIYAGDVHNLDSSTFVEMMVIDGCFIIELLIGYYYGGNNRIQLKADNWTEPLVRNDLLLLENQIPFFILQSLFDLSNFSDLVDLDVEDIAITIPITLTKLALCYITRYKFDSLPEASDPNLTTHHLLHLYQLSFRPTPEEAESTASTYGYAMVRTIENTKSFASGLLLVLLSLFVCQLRVKSLASSLLPIKYWKGYRQPADEEAPTVQSQRAPRMIPNATQLRECGIEFKKEEKAASLLDVVFRDGVMKIPELAIQEDTPSKFRNLIAFEQCCPSSGSHFTSYATLLNNLVDTPRDVAILKECGIIESKLGQDEEVAELFNSICNGASLDYGSHHFAKLFKQVKQYSEDEQHKWRASLRHDYFSSPWATISLFAAIFLLVLTALQTFFAINAYYRPPKQS